MLGNALCCFTVFKLIVWHLFFVNCTSFRFYRGLTILLLPPPRTSTKHSRMILKSGNEKECFIEFEMIRHELNVCQHWCGWNWIPIGNGTNVSWHHAQQLIICVSVDLNTLSSLLLGLSRFRPTDTVQPQIGLKGWISSEIQHLIINPDNFNSPHILEPCAVVRRIHVPIHITLNLLRWFHVITLIISRVPFCPLNASIAYRIKC